MTCCSDAKIDPLKRAGVCLACSLTCHENHELIELYTKRNFRCDCGNAKFNSHPCQFNANKADLNEDNTYNQNYSGLYCTCHRPYPDPDSTTEDEMIQCVICEDWLHASHLDAVVPDEAYAEMICKDCMEKNNFLHDYSSLAITAENVDIDVVNSSGAVVSNGIPESEGTLEKTKEQGIEMKDEADVNVSESTSAGVPHNTENKNETEINSESDAMKNSTNKLEKVESEDTSNDINTNKTTEVEGNGNSAIETVEAKTEEDRTEGKISENSTLSPDQKDTDCKSDLTDNENSTLIKETNENGAKNVNKEESVQPSTQDTGVTVADKAKSDNDIAVTDVKESKNIRDYELELEEELLKEPTDTDRPNDQQEDGIEKGITKSNIESDKEPVTDSTNEAAVNTANEQAVLTTNGPAMDTSNESAMDTANEAPIDMIKEPAIDTTNDPSINNTNEPAMDTTNEPAIDTTAEAVSATENIPPLVTSLDTKESTEMDVEKNEEIDSSKTELQTSPDNSETSSEQNSKLESINTEETDTRQDVITEDKLFTNEDSMSIEKDSTKDEETNSIVDETNKKTNTETVEETVACSNENKRKLSIQDKDDGAKRIKTDESKSCIRPSGKRHLKGATFWPSNFRQKLCTCNECLSMYKDLSVLFLIDCEDTVAAYEMLGKERSNGNSQYEKGLQALSSLDRIQQINAVTEYNKMREKLSDFLKSFMLKKEVVKEEDIKAFFAGMKPKREPDGVYFCR